jgi:hypothetical protein
MGLFKEKEPSYGALRIVEVAQHGKVWFELQKYKYNPGTLSSLCYHSSPMWVRVGSYETIELARTAKSIEQGTERVERVVE